MADIRVKINATGMAELKRKLAFGMLNLGLYIEGRAKEYVPVKTGNLRRSIHTLAFSDGQRIGGSGDAPDYAADMKGTGVIVGTNAGYGAFVELGTSRMRARPFLTPAYNDGIGKAAQLIEAGAKRG